MRGVCVCGGIFFFFFFFFLKGGKNVRGVCVCGGGGGGGGGVGGGGGGGLCLWLTWTLLSHKHISVKVSNTFSKFNRTVKQNTKSLTLATTSFLKETC